MFCLTIHRIEVEFKRLKAEYGLELAWAFDKVPLVKSSMNSATDMSPPQQEVRMQEVNTWKPQHSLKNNKWRARSARGC